MCVHRAKAVDKRLRFPSQLTVPALTLERKVTNPALENLMGAPFPNHLVSVCCTEELFERACANQLTLSQDSNAIADLFHIPQNVGVKENCLALFFQGKDNLSHLVTSDGVKSRHGLIQKDQFWVIN
jgi:hypothetical protein